MRKSRSRSFKENPPEILWGKPQNLKSHETDKLVLLIVAKMCLKCTDTRRVSALVELEVFKERVGEAPF